MNGTPECGRLAPASPEEPAAGLVDATRAAMTPEALQQRWGPGFRHRPGQVVMAEAVAAVLGTGGALAVQAGTGVGKTLAYLVPLLLSGRRAILSTATQALQDQLFHRDIPAVTRALGLPVRLALLKGRSAYVCLHRLRNQTAIHVPGRDPADSVLLAQLLRWAEGSASGDLAEVPSVEARPALRPLITSTRDNCLATECPELDRCAVYRARRAALEADWVVVNHHVFMADLDVRESGVAALLPLAEAIVFDEAHQLNDTAIGFLGRRVTSARWTDLARDVVSATRVHAAGVRPWSAWTLDLERCSRTLGELAGSTTATDTRIPWDGGAPAGVDAAAWNQACVALDRVLGWLHEGLQAIAEAAPDLARLAARVADARADWRLLVGEPAAPGEVRWLSRHTARRWEVHQTPADSAGLFPGLLAARPELSWVFTSATLGHDESLSWFTRSLGLAASDGTPAAGVRVLRVQTAFDHMRQAALHVPPDLPEPGEPGHLDALGRRLAAWVGRLGGRTLVLTTTNRAARQLAEQLRLESQQGGSGLEGLMVLAPTASARRHALETFRRSGDRPMVLIASGGLWDGVDLPGDALQLVVIDKLPFPPPDDPLVQARVQHAREQGVDGFVAVHLAEAALALGQGAGRLIRSETDRGVVVLADGRVLRRSYGPMLMSAMPPMRWLATEDELLEELDALVRDRALTRPSTTGFPGF